MFQLPKHKAVVVSLRDSDDSDSDVDDCNASQMPFGGLEFMIKEARRTVEVGPAHCSQCRQATQMKIFPKEGIKNRTFDLCP